ncbi:MAG: sulfite exporter TauE/SafE family protein [Acidobacteriota bacterium]
MEYLLILAAFVSSTLTATLGIGGGVLLISLMPGLLPAMAVVPVHGAVQLASNLSRAALGRTDIQWRLVGIYAVGAVLGAALGARVVVAVPERVLPLLLGSFILLVTWAPKSWFALRWPGKFATVGAVQTFVSLFVGAAGPLVTPVLLREGLSRDRIVVTHGAMMSLLHLLKLVAFGAIGFSLAPYVPLLAGMIVSATLGSWVGTRLRSRVPEARFRKILKIALTLLALRLIVRWASG